jgi:hypothetical protein
MYIRVKIQDVIDGIISVDVDKELSDIAKKYDLNIQVGDNIGQKTLWTDIEGYRYLLVRFYDLENKNRKYLPSIEEINELGTYVITKGFEIVENLPVLEEL